MEIESKRWLVGVGAGVLLAASGSAVAAGDVVVFDAPDAGVLLAEDVDREVRGLAPRFAVPQEVNYTPANSGEWRELGDGLSIWTLRVASPGVENINLAFLDFELPEVATLHVGATDGSYEVRPFTAGDNNVHRQLWTPVIKSDDVTVELIVPTAGRDKVSLQLGFVNLGYRPFGERPILAIGDAGRSGSCNFDVACPESEGWEDEIASVAVISTGGSTFCTGFMVNNVQQDRTPYFMTAFHCGVGAGQAPSLVAYWNFENSTCRAPGSSASGGNGDGVLSQFTTGATLRAASSASDFTLLELNSQPLEEYEVAFAGWDNRFYEPGGAVAIHHPSTDEKRISFEFDQTASTVGLTSSPEVGVLSSTHLKVRDWDLGTTEPGSSGSPVFDPDTQRVLGQLHGGTASCSSQTYDGYGRIARSWDNGSLSNSLQPWLDPNDTGAEFVDTLPANGLVVDPGGDTLSIGMAGGPFTNDTVTYSMSNSSGADVDYDVSILDDGTPFMQLTSGRNATGTIGDGESLDFVAVIGADAAKLEPGIYTSTIVFEDQTNSQVVERVHTLEIGQSGFSMTPDIGLFAGGPVGGPFTGEITYTLESTRPTPAQITVSASAPWVSIDGSSSPKTFTLSGVGDTESVTIGYSSFAATLPAGFRQAEVTFENATDGNGTTTRDVTLDVGRFRFQSDDTPIAIESNESFTSSIFVTDDFPIADVDVTVDITHTWIGDLDVSITSPAGTTVTLHDRSGSSSDDIFEVYDDDAGNVEGPGALADFNGESMQGEWVLRVADEASLDEGSLNTWELGISAEIDDLPCPGDVDNSGGVGPDDLFLLLSTFGQSVPVGTGGDIDNNGLVGPDDLFALLSVFGTSCP